MLAAPRLLDVMGFVRRSGCGEVSPGRSVADAERAAEAVMDPVSLVVGALAAGVSGGLSDTTKALIGDLYARIKTRLAGRPAGQAALEEYATDPDAWATPLANELAATDPGADALWWRWRSRS